MRRLFHMTLCSLLFIWGCSRSVEIEDDHNPLYEQMLEQSDYYSSLYHDYMRTKSCDDYPLDGNGLSFDSCEINGKYIEYIEAYIQPDNANDWDEKAILDRLNKD